MQNASEVSWSSLKTLPKLNLSTENPGGENPLLCIFHTQAPASHLNLLKQWDQKGTETGAFAPGLDHLG